LVAQGEDLDLKGRSATERRQNGREERCDHEGCRETAEEAQLPCSHAVRDLREAQSPDAPVFLGHGAADRGADGVPTGPGGIAAEAVGSKRMERRDRSGSVSQEVASREQYSSAWGAET